MGSSNHQNAINNQPAGADRCKVSYTYGIVCTAASHFCDSVLPS